MTLLLLTSNSIDPLQRQLNLKDFYTFFLISPLKYWFFLFFFTPLSAIRHPAKVICIAEVMACPDLEESRGFCCHLQTGDAWARPLFCLCLPLGLNATTKLSCLQIFPGICQIGENSVTTTTEHSLSGLLGDWNQTKKKSNFENYRSRCLMHVQDKKDRVISLSVLKWRYLLKHILISFFMK